jgi:hypothetical protein
MKTRIVFGQPSWRIATKTVEAFVTRTGGHLAPITFRVGGRRISPMSVAPWAEEKLDSTLPPILRVLRGDFFCMPFGGNATPFREERHPVHGETANAQWQLAGAAAGHLHLRLRTKIRPGQVDKHIFLRPGQTIVYQRHVITGMRGPMSFGHHATVKFPDEPDSGVISTSRFVHGQVFPGWFERPENRGYQSLKPGAVFKSLTAVPTLTGERADLSRYPARRGFEDLVQLVADPKLKLAWTAVVFPKQRYVWFSLRDPRVLTGTLFWITNGGRHMPPWNGRHVNIMGLEDCTTYFASGLAESVAAKRVVQLDPRQPFVVNYIFGVAGIPNGFDRVASIAPVNGGVRLRAANGRQAFAAVDLDFLTTRV